MSNRERFEGFDFVSGTRGDERLGERLQWPALEAVVANAALHMPRAHHGAGALNARYVYSFR